MNAELRQEKANFGGQVSCQVLQLTPEPQPVTSCALQHTAQLHPMSPAADGQGCTAVGEELLPRPEQSVLPSL